MPDYRRYFIEGGTYFFTLVSYQRRKIFDDPVARNCLHAAFEGIRKDYPFEVNAIVLMPEHLHTIWTLPVGDARYPLRWRRIKAEFTKRYLAAGGTEGFRSPSRKKRKERSIWQRRFWEHLIQDEDDYERHFDYIHYNPVKHGLVSCPKDWPYSSFDRWQRKGVYELDWGCSSKGSLDFGDLDESAME